MRSSFPTAALLAALCFLPMAAEADGDAKAPDTAPQAGVTGSGTHQPSVAARPSAVAPRSSNKWRIQFDESAKSDGIITFRVWTLRDTTSEVVVSVRNNQGENAIARSTRDAFRAVLGKGYKVEIDDGEDVLIKTKGSTQDLGLALISSSAADVDVKIKRE